MEKIRQNIVEKDSGIHRIQDDYNSKIVNLDREEQVLALELDELSNQRDQLRKALLESNASLFIAKKHVLVFLVFILFVAGAGLLVAHKHVLYKDVPQQQGVLN